MSIQCHCDLDYKELFTKQLVQTLGQLAAGVLSTSLIVPFYAYYRGTLFGHNYSYESDDTESCGFCEDDGVDDDETENRDNINNVKAGDYGYNSDIEDLDDLGGIGESD